MTTIHIPLSSMARTVALLLACWFLGATSGAASTPFQATMAESIPASDYQALVAFYGSTGGAGWTDHEGWNNPDAGAWLGVTITGLTYDGDGNVDQKGRVTALVLYNNNLTGNLAGLAGLTQLTVIFLQGNHLGGTLAPLAGLTQLQRVEIYNNPLTGTLGPLAGLTQLMELQASGNQFTGDLEPLANLTLMHWLDLRDNDLSGDLSALADMAQLNALALNGNRLTGDLSALADLTNLTNLQLDDNQLTGDLKPLSGLFSLQYVELSGNRLGGDASAAEGLTALTAFDVSFNLFDATDGSAFLTTMAALAKRVANLDYEAQGPWLVTSPLVVHGTAGQAFGYQIEANNFPESYAATGLPDGLLCNPDTGLIYGFPAAPGTSLVSLTATGPYGIVAKGALGITIDGMPTPTPTPPPNINYPLDVDTLSQGDKGWAGDTYDHTTSTIQEKGCALTSLTMAINYVGDDFDISTTPRDFNKAMNANAADYADGAVNWGSATKHISGNRLQYNDDRFSTVDDPEGAKTYLTSVLTTLNVPVIVGVNLNADGVPHHFVLVTGRQGNQFLINDPGNRNNKTLDAYKNSFETRGYVYAVPPPKTSQRRPAAPRPRAAAAAVSVGDDGALYVSSSGNVRLQVVDPAGNMTGTDFTAGTRKETIPRSTAFTDALDDDVTGAAATASTHFVYIEQPADGGYQVNVQGVDAGPYTLTVSRVSSYGTLLPPMVVNGTASVGGTSAYAVPVAATVQPVVTAVAAGPVAAGHGKGVITVSRTGDTAFPLLVAYKIKGSARMGVDYKMLPGTVMIPAGAAKAKIKLKTLVDPGNGGTRVAKFQLLPVKDGSYLPGSPAAAKIKITGQD